MRSRRFLQAILGLAGSILATASAWGQSVHGIVAGAGGAPVPGVVVQLLNSANVAISRALTNARGEYRLAAPRAGPYRIRTLRIGFRSTVSGLIPLEVGRDESRSIALAGAEFSLDTLKVVGVNSCALRTDSSAATYRVWEQVRTALIAAQLTGSAHVNATTLAYERLVDAKTQRVRRQSTRVATAYVNAPWLALPPDSLRTVGYMVTMPDYSSVYYAPDIDALLADSFVDDHCFHLVRDSTRVGVAFVPAPHRTRLAELRGTLWLNRASSELRSLEFGYANVSPEQEARAGGNMDFVRMRDGKWAISSWNIRMPVLEQRVVSSSVGGSVKQSIIGESVLELIVAGGDLVLARTERDTLWAQPARVLSGVVTDSLSGQAIGGAWMEFGGTSLSALSSEDGKFSVIGLLPGVYDVTIHTAALDELNAQHQTAVSFTGSTLPIKLAVPPAARVISALCGDRALTNPGIVLGHLGVRGDSAPPRDIRILAEWPTANTAVSSRMESRIDGSGTFRFCGVPLNTSLTLRAQSDSGLSPPSAISMTNDSRFTRAELYFDWRARKGAELFGVVLADSTNEPLAGAEVSLPALAKVMITNDSGVFRLSEVPVGVHRFVVRRFGYGPLETQLEIASLKDVQRRVLLTRSVTLERVTTTESLLPASFEENRRMGYGTFVTRDELVKARGQQLSMVMEMKRGVGVVHGRGGHTWVIAKRGFASACNNAECLKREGRYYVPSKAEIVAGIIAACYAQVYIDGTIMNPGRPTEPFDLNTVPPEQIEGIEFYSGQAQIPMKYASRSAGCGVMQIWSRRSP